MKNRFNISEEEKKRIINLKDMNNGYELFLDNDEVKNSLDTIYRTFSDYVYKFRREDKDKFKNSFANIKIIDEQNCNTKILTYFSVHSVSSNNRALFKQ